MEVLVTGGDTDLGRTVAEAFRDGGHKVTLVGARRSDLEVNAKELDVDAIVCDTTDPASLEEARPSFPITWTPSSTCPPRPGTPATPRLLHRRHGQRLAQHPRLDRAVRRADAAGRR